jgi:ATP-binding cassette subfamily B protein
MGYFTEGNIGKISSILSSDMVFIEEQSMQVIGECISDVFSQLILTVFLFALHPALGGVMLITTLVAVLVAQPMQRRMVADAVRRQDAIEGMTTAVLEYAGGMGVIKSYGLTGESATELREGFSEMTASNLYFENRLTPWQRALLIVYGIGQAATLTAAVLLYGQGALTGIVFVGTSLMAFNLFASLKHYYSQGAKFIVMKTGLQKLKAVMDERELPDDGEAVLPETAEAESEIEFRKVTFSYGGEDVLRDISFSAAAGQTLALVGASGSGKTTIASLLARFWDIRDGEILMRGADIRSLPLDTLMAQVSMVFQKVYLFEDTAAGNIAMGRRGASREEVIEAAKKSHCYDFIMKLPYGFDTYIGAGGATLSGGEAQRISIARCILKDAPIIILDEATASIDAENESRIQAALSNLCRGKTTIVIAHRLNTIRNADRILLLEKGRIVEEGSHDELARRGGADYRMICAGGEAV